jgi:putative polyketide hydroxylase
VDDTTVIFGYRYTSTAIATEPSTSDGPLHDPTTCTGQPGLRAPHVWLRRNGTQLSTLDLFGETWCLLAAGDWAAAAKTAATELGVPVAFHHVNVDLDDPDGRFAAAYGIGDTGASLVRPDGFVAWRNTTLPADADRVLTEALARLIHSAR